MRATRAGTAASGGARLSIGALARASGIPVETIRTWESRYGFPVPERKPSGHRVYPLSNVARLKRIAEALARGNRAGQVVGASDAELQALLGATAGPPGPAPAAVGSSGVDELLRLVESFDAERLTRLLLADWARLGPLEFLETRIAPMARAVGEAWEEGRLGVRHEHFLSERIGDLLRSLRLPFEEHARGALVVIASLPGEAHALGLQMAALALSFAGSRVLYVGAEVPPPEMLSLVRDTGARALGLSVSVATRGPRTKTQIRRLRAALPKRVALLVGGEGAPDPWPGVEVVRDLRGLDAWARRMAG
jgi:methanogenic corrinoid protein MtbC1